MSRFEPSWTGCSALWAGRFNHVAIVGGGLEGSEDRGQGMRKTTPLARSLDPISEVIASTEFDRFDRGGDDKPVEEIAEIIVFGQIFDIGA